MMVRPETDAGAVGGWSRGYITEGCRCNPESIAVVGESRRLGRRGIIARIDRDLTSGEILLVVHAYAEEAIKIGLDLLDLALAEGVETVVLTEGHHCSHLGLRLDEIESLAVPIIADQRVMLALPRAAFRDIGCRAWPMSVKHVVWLDGNLDSRRRSLGNGSNK